MLVDRTQVKQLDSVCRDMLKGISEVAVSVSRGANLNTMDLTSLVPKKEEQKVPEVVAEPEQVTKGKLDKLRTGIIVSTLLGENVNSRP